MIEQQLQSALVDEDKQSPEFEAENEETPGVCVLGERHTDIQTQTYRHRHTQTHSQTQTQTSTNTDIQTQT